MTKSDTRTVKINNPRESPGGRAGWQADVADLMRLSSVPSLVLDGPPTASEYKLQQPNIDEASAAELCNAAMAEYQRYNTVLWDIIRPSVVIAGPWEEIDQDHIRDNFINGDLRDGVGLYHWASAFLGTQADSSHSSRSAKTSPTMTACACRIARCNVSLCTSRVC